MISIVVSVRISDRRGTKCKEVTVTGDTLASIRSQLKDLVKDVKNIFVNKDVDVVIWGEAEEYLRIN